MAKHSGNQTSAKERRGRHSPPSRAGGIAVRSAGALTASGDPTGGSLLALNADASGQLEGIAPTFGNILSSVGVGVANSQAALDKGVVDTVKTPVRHEDHGWFLTGNTTWCHGAHGTALQARGHRHLSADRSMSGLIL